MKRLLLYAGLLLSGPFLRAQETFPVNGAVDEREGLFAFTHATIYQRYDKKLEDATLLIRKGKIVAIGPEVKVPEGAIVQDLKGKYIYPGLIEIYSNYGIPEARNEAGSKDAPATRKGAFGWNDALKSDFDTYSAFASDESAAEEWRSIGFGAVVSHRMDGISRGSSALLSLGRGRENLLILKERAAHQLSFSKGSSTNAYPSSLMGVIALLRQTYLDGQWYAQNAAKEETNLSLQAWNNLQALPQIFEVGTKLDALRALAVGKEFGLRYILKTGGEEYQRLDAFKEAGASLILPLNFPAAYDISDPLDAEQISLSDLKHWELAPYNPARVSAAGIEMALSTYGLKSRKDFMAQMRLAIEKGLSEEAALKALTWTPAAMVKAEDQLGSLDPGKWANFLVSSLPLFDADMVLYQNWIQGKRYVIRDMERRDLRGRYTLRIGSQELPLEVSGEPGKYKMQLKRDSTQQEVSFALQVDQLSLNFTAFDSTRYSLSGVIQEARWRGKAKNEKGEWLDWTAQWTGPMEAKADTAGKKKPETLSPGAVWYPFKAFGYEKRPLAASFVIRNATIWTNEKEGVLQQSDIWIEGGKIRAIGKGLKASGAREIDGSGKYVTCGIIDEHSHIAISRGVNEGTQASSAEVRIGDVLNSEDVNIYRQLAGGVTAAQILHGSANPIGGQSALIKLRWGLLPEQMKIEGAPGFIKFALGENVKQSNWNIGSDRFPQTRMGVEQVYEDYFIRAEEYKRKKASGKNIRRDLDLETLVEILDKKRFITCHSYVQSEVNMLMKVADKHHFKVNTFTHILEGYKIADKMRAHGVGASTFSDWWAYKMEVYEAIPYNAAILHGQGVVTAFNSDDAEMARRLNQEAAKAVKYGDVPEEEAWKMVTLNPAKLLHLDDRMGSLKTGKDADIVLWNANPLSVYASADKTWVDGVLLFDRSEQEQRLAEMARERARLISLSQKSKKDGQGTQEPRRRQPKLYECDTIEEDYMSDRD